MTTECEIDYKKPFPDQTTAQRELRNAIAKARGGQAHRQERSCYRCACGYWHLTKRPPDGVERLGPGYEPPPRRRPAARFRL